LTESVQAARLDMEHPSLIPTVDNDSTPTTGTLLLR
jgi:hypothetical protein